MGILPIRELARIPARDPTGDSGLPSPRLTGPGHQEQQRERLFCFCAQDTRALLFPGPHGIAAAAGDQAPQGGGARDRADSAVAQDVQSAEPDR